MGVKKIVFSVRRWYNIKIKGGFIMSTFKKKSPWEKEWDDLAKREAKLLPNVRTDLLLC